MPFTAAARAEIKSKDKLYLWKLVIRFITFLAAVLAVGFFAYDLSVTGFYGHSFAFTFMYFSFIPLGISIIYFIVGVCLLQFKRTSIHPGCDVGFDLVLWLAYILFSVFIFSDGVINYTNLHGGYYENNDDGYDYGDGYYNGPSDYNSSSPMYPILVRLINTELAGGVCLLILVLAHFILFVWACVDTEHRRRTRSARAIAAEMIAEMRERGELPPIAQPLLGSAGPGPVSTAGLAVRGAYMAAPGQDPSDVEMATAMRPPYRDLSPSPAQSPVPQRRRMYDDGPEVVGGEQHIHPALRNSQISDDARLSIGASGAGSQRAISRERSREGDVGFAQ